MKRATEEDVPTINRIMNDPDVRPWVFEGEGYLDYSGMTDALYILVTDTGVGIGEHFGDCEYIATMAVLPEGRGVGSVKLFYGLMDAAFWSTDAMRVYATINPDNDRSIRFFTKIGSIIRKVGDRVIAEWSFTDWAFKSDMAKKAGEEFNGILQADESTKKMLGAFALTLRGGWGGKAYHLYNKYAYLSLKPQIKVCNPEWTIFEWGGIKFEIGLDYIVEV